MSKATEAKAKPGLKMQTPREERTVVVRNDADRKRWEHLFSLNVWKPIR